MDWRAAKTRSSSRSDAKDDAQVTGTALTVVLAVIDRHARLSSEIGCNLGRIAKLWRRQPSSRKPDSGSMTMYAGHAV